MRIVTREHVLLEPIAVRYWSCQHEMWVEDYPDRIPRCELDANPELAADVAMMMSSGYRRGHVY